MIIVLIKRFASIDAIIFEQPRLIHPIIEYETTPPMHLIALPVPLIQSFAKRGALALPHIRPGKNLRKVLLRQAPLPPPLPMLLVIVHEHAQLLPRLDRLRGQTRVRDCG